MGYIRQEFSFKLTGAVRFTGSMGQVPGLYVQLMMNSHIIPMADEEDAGLPEQHHKQKRQWRLGAR